MCHFYWISLHLGRCRPFFFFPLCRIYVIIPLSPPFPSIPQSRLCVCTHTLTGAERWSQLWGEKKDLFQPFFECWGAFSDLIRLVLWWHWWGYILRGNSALDFKDRPFVKKNPFLETQTSDFLIYLVLYFFPPPVLHTRPFFRSVVPLLFLSLSLLPTTKKKIFDVVVFPNPDDWKR